MKNVFSLNPAWRFCREEAVEKAAKQDMFHMFDDDTKTGAAAGPASDGYYDGDWQMVDLPDDWCVRAEYDRENGGQGLKPRSGAWYRRCFFADPAWDGKRVFLRFDGIAIHSKIWLNGILIAQSTSGYTPISEEITQLLRYGDGNVLSVYAENRVQEGWWYEGGGIYRDVWLTVTEDTRIREDGVFVRAEKLDDDRWNLRVRTETDGDAEGCSLRVSCLGETAESLCLPVTETEMQITNPPVWDPETPNLVPVSVQLLRDGQVIDEETVSFGFRTVRFDSETGCYVNGKPIKLKGFCMHHDHAGVGAAMTYPIQRYRIERLKAMGCNAIRTSHNPQSPDFYRVCDEMGILVMNETRHFSATREVLQQLEAFVRRDRNHPCVIFWSLFNEEPLQCSPVGEKIALRMKKLVYKLDGTRPVSGGMNGALEPQGAVHAVDMMGFNYLQYGYDDFHALHPEMPMYGSENDSWCTCRGEKDNNLACGYRSAILREFPGNLHPWAEVPGETWRKIEERPFVMGGFSWTGMDYRGEAVWPAVVSHYGAHDLCGYPKDGSHWYRALWNSDPQLKLSYAWVGTPGEEVTVVAYSNCETVELILNGRSLGEHKNNKYNPEFWRIAFEAGELLAIGRNGGVEVIRDVMRTPGKAAKLCLTASVPALSGVADVLVVDAAIQDENGTVLWGSRDKVSFTVRGGKLLGVGNGDPACLEPDDAPERSAYHGLCQAIFRPEKAGEMVVCAKCGELIAEIRVPVGDAGEVPSLPAAQCRLVVAPWRMSDVKETYPSMHDILSQMVNWIPTTVGCGKNHILSGKTGYGSITGMVTAPRMKEGQQLYVVLERIMGCFDLYLDENKVFSAEKREDRGFRIPCPALEAGSTVTLALVFRLDGGDCGVPGSAYLVCE